MTQIKARAFELINRLPDDKIFHIVNILQDLDTLYGKSTSLQSGNIDSMKAFEELKKYIRPSTVERDYKEELARALEEKYESIS